MLKEERGSLALDDQVSLLLQSLASDAAAVRATALQARASLRLFIFQTSVDGRSARPRRQVSPGCFRVAVHMQY